MKSILKKDIIIGLLLTIVLWGMAEIALRIYVEQVLRPAHGLGVSAPWKIPDAELGWKPRPGYRDEKRKFFYINSQGFKGAEFLEKTESVYRIVALGESTTFGLTGGDYPTALQTLLNEAKAEDCNLQFEVINGGVEGYDSRQIFLRFQRDVIPLEPDMIVVYAGWNDLYRIDPEDPLNTAQADSTFNRLLEYSYVLKAATKIVYDYILPPFEDTGEERQKIYAAFVSDQFIDNYNKIIILAHQNDIQVVGFTLPSLLGAEDAAQYEELFHYPHYTRNRQLFTVLWRSYNQAISENLKSHNASVIDLAQPIEAMSGEGQYFFDTLHFYEEGYRIVATIILNGLVEQDLLPCSLATGAY